MGAVTRETALLALSDHVSERSFAHCEAVALESESLARRFGVDPDDAWLAGLLHDWSRDVPAEELVARATELGISVADVDAAVPYLLHAEVAAVELAQEFPGLGKHVLDAVERHTVGSPLMSALDMCVYVADMIEPARSFDGVEALRQAIAVEGLQELYARAYAASLAHLVTKRKYIHPQSVEAWNAIVAEGRR